MQYPELKGGETAKLIFMKGNLFYIYTWNEKHVDEYVWDGASENYSEINAYHRMHLLSDKANK